MSPTPTLATATLDDRDVEIVARCMAALDAREGPRVGDYVIFLDGITRRISYHWTDGEGWDGGCQTSDGGSYHLGEYGVSMSGSLYGVVPTSSLTDTGETRDGSAWIFHHGRAGAHRAVHFARPFRVFNCDQEAPR